MAYVSWSVVFGEQPSAAKWNILGSNDASFNDGSGIGTNAVDSEKLNVTVAFRATTTQSIATSASFSNLTSYTEVFDYGANFASGVFTAPQDGVYEFFANVGYDDPTAGSTRFGVKITANATVVASGYVSPIATNHDPRINVASGPVYMTATETANAAVYQDSGGSETMVEAFFAGILRGGAV